MIWPRPPDAKGEYDVLAYFGWLYEPDGPKAKRWPIVLCWKRKPRERSRQRRTGTAFPSAEAAEAYVGRLNAQVAAARLTPAAVKQRLEVPDVAGLPKELRRARGSVNDLPKHTRALRLLDEISESTKLP